MDDLDPLLQEGKPLLCFDETGAAKLRQGIGALRQEAEYFKSSYSRKLNDEARALETAQALIEENTAIKAQAVKLEEALRTARYELRDYTRSDMGSKNYSVIEAIEEMDAAIGPLSLAAVPESAPEVQSEEERLGEAWVQRVAEPIDLMAALKSALAKVQPKEEHESGDEGVRADHQREASPEGLADVRGGPEVRVERSADGASEDHAQGHRAAPREVVAPKKKRARKLSCGGEQCSDDGKTEHHPPVSCPRFQKQEAHT